ncbi:hypothetical protein N9M16_06195 [Candidatus Dependentiae bacterium]|nr:hypothetical protein [Candidatus Dependentiae bacterium]
MPRCWPHIATRGHVNTRALVSHTRQSDAASSPGETSFTTVVERVADTRVWPTFFRSFVARDESVRCGCFRFRTEPTYGQRRVRQRQDIPG